MHRSFAAALVCFGFACVNGESQAAPVTFNKEIAPILFKHCAACHRPDEIAPFSLLTFADASKRAEQIAEVIERRTMPPWKPTGAQGTFLNDRRLTAEEIALVKQWAADGAVEGKTADLPPPPKFTDDWKLGKPDLVLTVSEPIVVPAGGADLHMNVVLPLKVPPGKFLKATEVRPGNPHVVHHAVLYIDVSGKARERDQASRGRGFLAVAPPGTYLPGALGMWTPGRNPMPLPKGLAMRWPVDAVLVLHLHLHPTGKAETEQSTVGFYFTSEVPERPLVDLTLVDATINIPAGDKNYRTHDRKIVPADSELLTIFPHMHMLGREMHVAAHHPDGTVQTLIDIDDWDYNWQDLYQYVAPVRLPAGTVVTLDARYDNSTDNPQNPRNPPARVKWGEEAVDEMSLAFLSLAPLATSSGSKAGAKPADAALQPALAAWRNADADVNDRLTIAEIVTALGKQYGRRDIEQMVQQFDGDGDKQLNFDEFLMAWKAAGNR